jgi:hypothetical protein
MKLIMRFALLLATLLTLAVQAAEKYDVLAVHKTKATFKGTREHRCMGLTALCPDRCGDSGTMAIFAIDEYTLYEKRGEYGDDKQVIFQFLTENNMKQAKIPAELLAKIKTLKPGDKVMLEWEHRYMDRDGSRWPERPVVKLEKIP